MSINKVLIVTAEPKSVFLEILFKYLNSKKYKKNKVNFSRNKKIIQREAKIYNLNKEIKQVSNFESAVKDKLNIFNIEIKKIIKSISPIVLKILSLF